LLAVQAEDRPHRKHRVALYCSMNRTRKEPMPRPPKPRRICAIPETSRFVPCGQRSEECVEMTVDEFEAIRLIDGVGQTQEECAALMNVSRTTVQAIYDSARKKIAEMLVCGKSLFISGGSFEICSRSATCCKGRCSGLGAFEGECDPSRSTCPYCRKKSRS
jgi:predicted DNA-binding protein (UPF0251 family)